MIDQRISSYLMLWVKRQLGNLAGRVEEYERLLEDLWNRVGDDDQNLIRTTLDKVEKRSWTFIDT